MSRLHVCVPVVSVRASSVLSASRASAESTHFKHLLKATSFLRKQLVNEMRDRSVLSSLDEGQQGSEYEHEPPQRLGDYVYYAKMLHEIPVYFRKKAQPASPRKMWGLPGWTQQQQQPDEEEVLDLRELVAKWGYCRLRMMSISKDNTMLAFVADVKGAESHTLFVKNLVTGALLPLETTEGVVTAEWLCESNDTLLYTLEDDKMRPFKVCRRKVGRSQALDETLFEEGDDRFFVDVARTKDYRFMTVNSNSKISSEIRILHPETGVLSLLKKREPHVEYFVDHTPEGRFYILTNAGGCSNFKICTVEDSDPSFGKPHFSSASSCLSSPPPFFPR